MALFLNDTNINSNRYLNSLIHSYNKHCFSDYQTAEETLLNKVLLPGEVVFAYYNDATSPYGQNAIAAVGSLLQGSGNIIFKNSLVIDLQALALNESIAYINTSINYLREDLYNDLETTTDLLNLKMDNLRDDVKGPLNIYELKISALENEVTNNKTDFNNNLLSSVSYLKNEIDTTNNSFNILLNNMYTNLKTDIENTSTYIINYVDLLLTNSFGNINSSTNELVNNTSNKIVSVINDFKGNLESLILKTNEKHNIDILNLLNYISALDSSVTYNTNRFNDFKHEILHKIDDINLLILLKFNDLSELINKINK